MAPPEKWYFRTMLDFSSTLLREKFVIRDISADLTVVPVVALSNRVVIHLPDNKGKTIETFVVRAQNMHACVRMAAKIVQSYMKFGPLMARDEEFDYADAWDDVIEHHDRKFNENIWVAVYNQGRRIFFQNEYHAFLDVIENCDARNQSGNYEQSISMAEKIFASMGRKVMIDHEANTGMVLDIKKGRARCGLILRSPTRRTNFTFSAEKKPGRDTPVNAAQCMSVAAAFLEGLHLAFLTGRVNQQLRLNLIAKFSRDDKMANSARSRLAQLNSEIRVFENGYVVRYRPERPEFPEVVVEAERYTRTMHELSMEEQERLERERLEEESRTRTDAALPD